MVDHKHPAQCKTGATQAACILACTLSASSVTCWSVQVIDDPSTDSLLLVMEHVDGGSLEQPYDAASKTWETLPEALVHRHFRELCKVCQHSSSHLNEMPCCWVSHG